MGQKFLQRHEAVTFVFDGLEKPLVMRTAVQKVVALAALNVARPRLFELSGQE